MRYRSIGVVLLLCLFMLPAVILAQNPSQWTIPLYARQTNTIYVVSSQGVQQAIAVPLYQGNKFIVQHVSNDYRYAAGLIEIPGKEEFDAPTHIPAIADLQAQICCVTIDAPIALSEEFFVQFSNFNADGTQVVLSTNNFSFDGNTGASQGGGVLSLVDVASGAILRQNELDSYAYLAGWYPDGVRFLPAPLGGTEWLAEGHYSIWDINAGAIRENTPELAVWRGDILPSTGEIIDAAYNEDFPAAEFGMITPANVLEYYPAGQNPFMNPAQYHTPGQVVFYNPQDLDIQTSWIQDGHAVLVHDGIWTPGDAVTVLFRGGRQQAISTPGQRYLVATPDGWLMYGTDGSVYQYAYTGSSFVVSELARLEPPQQDNYEPYLVPLAQPALGATVSGDEPDFPTVTRVIPEAPPNAVTCPGAKPSRMVVGQKGWVLPGDSNNLRDKPTRNGAKVGELSAGMSFDVLEGPVCADGYAWWHVEDAFNQNGWTAEGDGKDYWIEPIR